MWISNFNITTKQRSDLPLVSSNSSYEFTLPCAGIAVLSITKSIRLTGITSAPRTTYSAEALEFTLWLLVGFVLLNLQFSVQCYLEYCLSVCPFSCGHCIVCPWIIYSMASTFFQLSLYKEENVGTVTYVCICQSFLTKLRDRPFNLKGGLWFFVSFRILFFGQHKSQNIFLLSRQARIFFQEFNIRLYDKNFESDYFFFPPKSEYFFSATLGIRIFFQKKTITPPSS